MAFDIETYKGRTARLVVDDLDFQAFADKPLDDGALRCLQYMHDVEHHTICYLRDLLVTHAHRDPDITSFLTFWCFEEYWHGEAIGMVLEAHGIPAGRVRLRPMRRNLGWKDSLGPFTHSLGSKLAGESFIAVHMTWGAVNEWLTQAGYARLSATANHPLLTELLGRIMKQEGRHIDFYSSEAARRLANDKRARRLTRWALEHLWSPVGANVMPEAEVQHLVAYLFADEAGREMAERIDRRVDRLPGLEGLHLAVGSVARYAPDVLANWAGAGQTWETGTNGRSPREGDSGQRDAGDGVLFPRRTSGRGVLVRTPA